MGLLNERTFKHPMNMTKKITALFFALLLCALCLMSTACSNNDDGIPEGMKSVTIRLTIGSNEKTLNANEIEACANSVLKVLSKELGGEMRTK